ncbi:hypothetical protein BC827DRAFT_589468 [Russula dissimulans]|nr:hypothetical protein BC827DRAFT_589468 [Russula dissimulans]
MNAWASFAIHLNPTLSSQPWFSVCCSFRNRNKKYFTEERGDGCDARKWEEQPGPSITALLFRFAPPLSCPVLHPFSSSPFVFANTLRHRKTPTAIAGPSWFRCRTQVHTGTVIPSSSPIPSLSVKRNHFLFVGCRSGRLSLAPEIVHLDPTLT